MRPIHFSLLKEDTSSLARAGVLQTPHGDIPTPAFVAVGTKATVKALTPEQVKDLGASVVLANTYHLHLEPGEERVRAGGGLGAFMHWAGPTMTDSGGFQVFSLGAGFGKGMSKFLGREELEAYFARGEEDREVRGKETLARVDEEGVTFRSHIDGSEHRLTPESSLAIQHTLGADIIFAFDECTTAIAPIEYEKQALMRTHRWATRCLAFHNASKNKETQGLFGIVQGGEHKELREKSARVIGDMDFGGFGIGGSFTKEGLKDVLSWVSPLLPKEKPRHLLGIGEPEHLFDGVMGGADTFDCVAPTRMARNGALYTKRGRININNSTFASDFSPIDKDCSCYTCIHFTRSYVAHLFRSKELLAYTLASIHNLFFIVTLVKSMRGAILEDRLSVFRDEFLASYNALDK